jgi:flagella basal body P-ring formation protein FlgA
MSRVRSFHSVVCPLVAGLLLVRAVQAEVPRWQSADSIRDAAAGAVRAEAAQRGSSADATADRLDGRLRLAECAQPLGARIVGGQNAPRATVEVRCDSPGWKLYVPVQRSQRRAIVVARTTLPRGKVLTVDDVLLTERETSTLPAGYLTDLGIAVGQTLRRGVTEGTPVGPQALAAPPAVRAGQEVSLEAGAAEFRVRMAGVARQDAALGEMVKVENVSSRKIVQGIVRSNKIVEIAVP